MPALERPRAPLAAVALALGRPYLLGTTMQALERPGSPFLLVMQALERPCLRHPGDAGPGVALRSPAGGDASPGEATHSPYGGS
eukprot:14944554-Alexandrium_andersonii.AAC.1